MKNREIALAEIHEYGLQLRSEPPVNPVVKPSRLVHSWRLEEERNGCPLGKNIALYRIEGVTGSMVTLRGIYDGKDRREVDLEEFVRTGIHGSERFVVLPSVVLSE